MSKEKANKELAYLLRNVDRADKALTLFELLRKKTFTTGTVKQDNWLEEILLAFTITKVHTIFDKSKDSISLEKFLKGNARYISTESDMVLINQILDGIKREYGLLIRQIENNRHEEVHIAKKTNLGVTEGVAEEIREFGNLIGDEKYRSQESVIPGQMRFTVGNFPIEKARDLTTKLSHLIFGVQYPRTLDKYFADHRSPVGQYT